MNKPNLYKMNGQELMDYCHELEQDYGERTTTLNMFMAGASFAYDEHEKLEAILKCLSENGILVVYDKNKKIANLKKIL